VLAASGAQAADEIRIVLLPTVVHSAESPDYLRAGLADMIASRLERVQEFDVLRVDDPAAATTNLDTALALARESDADFVLFGSFTRFGTGASLDVQCASVRVESGHKPLREIFVHSGSIGDVIPDLDDLVGKVARFVIVDYQERAQDSNGLPELPSMRALNDLQRRVEALEEALRASSSVGPTADADAALPEELRIGEADVPTDVPGGLQ
jgi:TolB-like protein